MFLKISWGNRPVALPECRPGGASCSSSVFYKTYSSFHFLHACVCLL